jgi:hypothetical protein
VRRGEFNGELSYCCVLKSGSAPLLNCFAEAMFNVKSGGEYIERKR